MIPVFGYKSRKPVESDQTTFPSLQAPSYWLFCSRSQQVLTASVLSTPPLSVHDTPKTVTPTRILRADTGTSTTGKQKYSPQVRVLDTLADVPHPSGYLGDRKVARCLNGGRDGHAGTRGVSSSYLVVVRDDGRHLPASERDVLARQVVDGPGSWVQRVVEGILAAEAPVPALEGGGPLH